LNRALNQKRSIIIQGKCKVILLHDKARPYVVNIVKDMLLALQWKVLPHAVYSPGCAPSNYYLFRLMQLDFADQHLKPYEEKKVIR